MKKYWLLISTLCLCACGGKVSTDNKEEVGWQKETSGVWTLSVGTPEKVNLLSELHTYGSVRNLKDRRNDLYEVRLKKNK